MNISWLST